MAIRDLQVRFATIGAIRLGMQKQTRSGRLAPAKLDNFRITVRDESLANEIAELYGGNVEVWRPKAGNPGYEILTSVTELPVYVPRQNIDPNYELWGPGVLQRRCDGEIEQIRATPCLCALEAQRRCQQLGIEFDEQTWRTNPALKLNSCKPTTRLSVILAEVSVTGQFKLESHGWNAATELSVWGPIVEMAPTPLPAKIVLEKREKKIVMFENGRERIETRNFTVPVLDFGSLKLTGHQAFGGGANALESAAKRSAALAAGKEPQAAIQAAATVVRSSTDWISMIEFCDSIDELDNIRDAIKAASVTDRAVINAWRSRKALLTEAQQPVEPEPVAEVVKTPEVIVDAENEPDMDTLWNEILRVGGDSGMKIKEIIARYIEVMGHDPRTAEANGWKYEEFLKEFKK